MPYKHMTDETEWSNGVTIVGKVAKPGSKVIVHANGRQSLNFTIIIPSGIPLEGKIDAGSRAPVYWRCRLLDPEYVLNTSDIVRISGIMSKNGDYLSMLVNKCTVLARWIRKAEYKKIMQSESGQEAGQRRGR